MSFYPSGDLWPVQVRIYQAHLEQRALAQGLAERDAQTPAPATPAPTSFDRLPARLWRWLYWRWLLVSWR